MSGGYFEYKQHHIYDIYMPIEDVIVNNDSAEENKWGDELGRHYSSEVIAELKIGVAVLKLAALYAQRIDWLLSGDDGPEWFLKRLEEDLKELRNEQL